MLGKINIFFLELLRIEIFRYERYFYCNRKKSSIMTVFLIAEIMLKVILIDIFL